MTYVALLLFYKTQRRLSIVAYAHAVGSETIHPEEVYVVSNVIWHIAGREADWPIAAPVGPSPVVSNATIAVQHSDQVDVACPNAPTRAGAHLSVGADDRRRSSRTKHTRV